MDVKEINKLGAIKDGRIRVYTDPSDDVLFLYTKRGYTDITLMLTREQARDIANLLDPAEKFVEDEGETLDDAVDEAFDEAPFHVRNALNAAYNNWLYDREDPLYSEAVEEELPSALAERVERLSQRVDSHDVLIDDVLRRLWNLRMRQRSEEQA